MPSVSPAPQLEADAVDRLERQPAAPQQAADRHREMDREILDLQERLAHVKPSRWQALARPRPNSSSSGRSRQRSNAKGQRSRNAQPSGRAWRFGGCPGIVAELGRGLLVEARHRAKQSPGVRVLGVLEDRLDRPLLDDPAAVHHHDPLAQARDHAEVVGDQDDRHAELAPQRLQQLQDLRLHRDVERRGRLVGDQEVRLAKQRDRDHHPLAHAAGELVGVQIDPAPRRRNPHLIEQPHARGARVLLAHALVLDQHLGHLARDPKVRIERGHRVLEDHREADAADPVQRPRRQVQELLAAKAGAAGAAAVPGEQPHDREKGLGLARAGLADHAHALARLDPEADVAHRRHLALGRGEAGGQILDLQDRGHRPGLQLHGLAQCGQPVRPSRMPQHLRRHGRICPARSTGPVEFSASRSAGAGIIVAAGAGAQPTSELACARGQFCKRLAPAPCGCYDFCRHYGSGPVKVLRCVARRTTLVVLAG